PHASGAERVEDLLLVRELPVVPLVDGDDHVEQRADEEHDDRRHHDRQPQIDEREHALLLRAGWTNPPCAGGPPFPERIPTDAAPPPTEPPPADRCSPRTRTE